jgi:hypothetical protein
MTIQQTVEIPVSRKVHFYVSLPEDAPCGWMDVLMDFKSADVQTGTSGFDVKRKLDPSTEKMLKEAEKTWAYTRAHPEEVRNDLRALRGCTKGSPAWGGLDGVIYQRKIRDEWEM